MTNISIGVHMNRHTLILINTPLISLSLMANIFFALCIINPYKTRCVKQPLKILVEFVIYTGIICILLTTMICILSTEDFSKLLIFIFFSLAMFTVYVNMTSYVWLMFYYYIMIVPSQRALLVWVKKNIKSVIYVLLFLDILMFLGKGSTKILTFVASLYDNRTTAISFYESNLSNIAMTSIMDIYLTFCLCIMMSCSLATAHYLNKHMKSLAVSGGSLFNPRLHSQVRVTVTGILQGVLYFLYSLWIMVTVLWYNIQPHKAMDPYVTTTAVTLYISASTVNLGVGQALFKERAVQVWKAVEKQIGSWKMSVDQRPPGNNLTSLATVESNGGVNVMTEGILVV